jgi:hypothetical protein
MRLSTALVSLVLAVAVCHEARVEASELRLAEFRRIVVADKPSAVDKAAAEELGRPSRRALVLAGPLRRACSVEPRRRDPADRVKFHRFGFEYTKVLLELFEHYRKLTELGLKMKFAVSVKATRDDPAEREALLKRAYELGERREEMLLAHRDWAGPDEGLYAFTNDIDTRQWHAAVKKALGIDKASALTKATLAEKPVRPAKAKPVNN